MSPRLQTLGAAWRPLLEAALSDLERQGIALGRFAERELAFARLAALLDLVASWNARVDLTAARDARELVDLYLADAVVLAARGAGGRWIDVGSGGGAPGVVLGVLRPDIALTLVEPRQKRAAFLRTALGTLGLTTASIVTGRSETLPAGMADVAVSRATFAPAEWAQEGGRLARSAVWVLLARGETPAVEGFGARQIVDYAWPAARAPRRAVELARGEALPNAAESQSALGP